MHRMFAYNGDHHHAMGCSWGEIKSTVYYNFTFVLMANESEHVFFRNHTTWLHSTGAGQVGLSVRP